MSAPAKSDTVSTMLLARVISIAYRMPPVKRLLCRGSLRRTVFYDKLRRGSVTYRAFVFQNGAGTVNANEPP